MPRIYLSSPDVGPLERDYLLNALESGWVAPAGPELDGFERDVAALTGWPGAVALSSGTAALHLALLVRRHAHFAASQPSRCLISLEA